MLRIVLGFQTPDLNEQPEVLYIGHDGDAALSAENESLHPRVEVSHHLSMRAVRRWTPEASEEFEALRPAPKRGPKSKSPAPKPAPEPEAKKDDPQHPSLAAELAALDDAQLAAVAAQYEIPAPEAGKPERRAAVIDLILEAAAKSIAAA